jgi:tRNA dimethylallyltransferase
MDATNNQTIAHQDREASPSARPRLVVICGPTAVGKTALGIEIAEACRGEVVNADSRYFYRGFDIGVAKPEPGERRGVPHHLIDILPPAGEMSLARYQDLAMAAIAGILRRKRLPLLVGGTPLYINALVEGWRIPRVPPNPERREALAREAEEHGVAALLARLRAVDPIAAERSAQNLRRIIRALEVYEESGVPMSAQEGKGPPPFEALEIGLTLPRPALYQAIDARVASQIERGLVAEVRNLREGGVPDDAPAMSSLGYRQLMPYLCGDVTLEAAIARIRHDTHRYVRHQETWLRRNRRIIWFDTAAPSWSDRVFALVREFLDAPAG